MELSEFLMSRKDYVSGQEIADAMGISRNAVWKQIERLRREGVQVEAVTGKGYRIKDLSMAFAPMPETSRPETPAPRKVTSRITMV